MSKLASTASKAEAEQAASKQQKLIDRFRDELTHANRKASALELRCEELTKLLQDHQNVFSNLLQSKRPPKLGVAASKKGLSYPYTNNRFPT